MFVFYLHGSAKDSTSLQGYLSVGADHSKHDRIESYFTGIGLKEEHTECRVIFNPVGEDRFNPLMTGAIHSFPSLPPSASCKRAPQIFHIPMRKPGERLDLCSKKIG